MLQSRKGEHNLANALKNTAPCSLKDGFSCAWRHELSSKLHGIWREEDDKSQACLDCRVSEFKANPGKVSKILPQNRKVTRARAYSRMLACHTQSPGV